MKILKKSYKYLMLAAVFGMVVSCEEDFDNEVSDDLSAQTSGSADFTTYVALGNSLTSGYSNGSLYIAGQQNSYPAILANRFKEANPSATNFTIPFVKDEIGGLLLSGTQIADTKLVLSSALSPVNSSGTPTTDITSGIGAEGPYGNMGVPGAKSYHLLANGYGSVSGVATGTANPYYAYFATSSDTNVFADALSQAPTFFTLWIGNNDVLAYSTSGGDGDIAGIDQTGNIDPSTYGSNDISDPNVVIGSIQAMATQLTAGGASGVIANIPNVTSIPYFTTVPYNALTEAALTASDPDNIATLNANFAGLNQIFDAIGMSDRKITFVEGGNSNVVIKDSDLVDVSQTLTGALMQAGIDTTTATVLGSLYGQARQATVEDLLLLTSSSVIGTENTTATAAGIPANLAINGVTYPLEGKYVLTKTEAAKVQVATDAYNGGITAITAANPNLVMVDMKTALEELASTGFVYDGINYTDAYITGAAFSLDGVHPTPKGYAIISNYFIRAINSSFGATLLEVNPNTYPGL